MGSLRFSLRLSQLPPGNQSRQLFQLALLRRRDQLPRTLSRIVINRRLLRPLQRNLQRGQRHNLRRNQLSQRNVQPNLLHRQPDRRHLLPLHQQNLPKGQRHNLRRNQLNLQRSPQHHQQDRLSQRNHRPSPPRLRRSPPRLNGQLNRHNRPRVSNQLSLRPLNPSRPRSPKPNLRLSLPPRSQRNVRRLKLNTNLPRQLRRSRQKINRSRSNSLYSGTKFWNVSGELAKPELHGN